MRPGFELWIMKVDRRPFLDLRVRHRLPNQWLIPPPKEGEPVDIAAYSLQLRTKGLEGVRPPQTIEGGLDRVAGDEMAIWEELSVDEEGRPHRRTGPSVMERRPRGRHRLDLDWMAWWDEMAMVSRSIGFAAREKLKVKYIEMKGEQQRQAAEAARMEQARLHERRQTAVFFGGRFNRS